MLHLPLAPHEKQPESFIAHSRIMNEIFSGRVQIKPICHCCSLRISHLGDGTEKEETIIESFDHMPPLHKVTEKIISYHLVDQSRMPIGNTAIPVDICSNIASFDTSNTSNSSKKWTISKLLDPSLERQMNNHESKDKLIAIFSGNP
jgi:hypothetical protein